MSHKKELGVKWYLPTKKRCFAESTIATSDLIVALSEEYLTTKDVYNAINYDPDAKEILKYFIDNGYENFVLADMVHINNDRVYRKVEDGKIISIPFKDIKKHLDIKKENEYEYDYDY